MGGNIFIPDGHVSKPYALRIPVNAKKLIVNKDQKWYGF
jgi:hypothetical protein